MQNTPQTFRGSAAPGVNYSDHSYDNHLGGHCQSSGYQQYPSQVYHPRPHHYGNHQMQQNMPYRHHGGGAYAPNQNQYGSNMNQDMYRSHHPGYAGSNRNIPPKTWTENNSSSDLMPPYGQASPHSQMMNNPSQMPGNAMRSPPHAGSNINTSPQGQQHFRPMQSPGHSPHSWSQAQIPSPGMMHSRTSPLPAHVRSPGHSQPFSPPSAHSMNLQPHIPPQENGQIPQPMSSSGGGADNHNPGNPLHSLQKMVLLDQNPKGIMALPGDGSEQFSNQCGSHNYGPEECIANEQKDPQYSTYYNMDENRFESKPNSGNASGYVPVPQVTNCNYPVAPHPNESDAKNSARVPSNMNPNIAEAYHVNPNQNSILPPQMNSPVEQSQCKSNMPQNDCSLKQNECPPHAESAPVFTDQTKAAVSTNSEQALESKSNNNWVSDASDPEKASVAQVNNADSASTPLSSTSQTSESSNLSVNENIREIDNSVVNNKLSSEDHVNYTIKNSELNSEKQKDTAHPSIDTPSSESQDCDSNITSTDSKSSNYEDSQSSEKVSLIRQRSTVSYEEIPSPETESKKAPHHDSWSLEKNTSSDQKETESNSPRRNPVKVVIHRIRKSDANDTWHVPGNKSSIEDQNENEDKTDTVSDNKALRGPQIIMLSQAVSDGRSQNSSSSNSVISTDDNQTVDKDITSPVTVKEEPLSSPEKGSSNLSLDRKRPGRPAGSKNKVKSSNIGKNKRGKKGGKKRKNENSKQKVADSVSKIKKINKIFNGPFVRITGSKENPSTISVVNVAQKEEEKLSKTLTKRNVSTAVNRIKNKTVGHLSTLSPTYDAYNRDKTWVCVFCQKGSHHGGLGDLYGPYYIKDTSEDKQLSCNPGTSAPRNKRRKSETDDSKSPKRVKQASANSTPANRPEKTDDVELGEPMREVWLHEDCAVWCQTITLIGEEVRGLDEAVAEANENKCNQCAFHGATLGCWGKGCKEMYHYTCAKAIGCELDIEKFSLFCLKHQKKSSEIQNRCQ